MNYFLISFLLGTFFADSLVLNDFGEKVILGMMAALFLVFLIFRRDKVVKTLALFCLGILAALFYFQFFVQKNSPEYISHYVGQEITLQGKIADYPQKDDKNTKLTLKINNIKGKILVFAPNFPEREYGEEIKVKGKLEEPPVFDEFSYRNYLKGKGIYATIRNPEIETLSGPDHRSIRFWLWRLKTQFEDTINKILPEPEAGLANGLLLGTKTGLSDTLMQIFIAVGIVHIIALSGYNVTIIARSLSSVFNRFLPQISFSLSIFAVWLFVLMVGASASIVRAAIMGTLLLLAQKIGRRRDITRIVLLTAFAMVLANPYILRYDSGFQLSFVATIAMLILVPILTQKIKNWRLPKPAKEAGSATISAQLFVLPLLLLNFKKISLVSPLTNILILPFIPAAMFLVFFSGIFGMLFLPLGRVVGFIAFIFLKYIILVSENFSRLSFASIDIKSKSLFWAIFYWALLYFLIRFIQKRTKKD